MPVEASVGVIVAHQSTMGASPHLFEDNRYAQELLDIPDHDSASETIDIPYRNREDGVVASSRSQLFFKNIHWSTQCPDGAEYERLLRAKHLTGMPRQGFAVWLCLIDLWRRNRLTVKGVIDFPI